MFHWRTNGANKSAPLNKVPIGKPMAHFAAPLGLPLWRTYGALAHQPSFWWPFDEIKKCSELVGLPLAYLFLSMSEAKSATGAG